MHRLGRKLYNAILGLIKQEKQGVSRWIGIWQPATGRTGDHTCDAASHRPPGITPLTLSVRGTYCLSN